MASPYQSKATHFSCQLWQMEATNIHEHEMYSLRNQTDKTQAKHKTVDGKINKTRKNVQQGTRNWLSIDRKLEIIEAYENNRANFAKLSYDFGMHELTVRAIIRRKEEIKASVKKNIATKNYDDNIDKSKLADDMEKLLISNQCK